MLFKDRLGVGIFTVNNYQHEKPLRVFNPGENVIIRTDLKFPLLRRGKYTATIAISDGNQDEHIQHHWIHDAFIITLDNNALKFNKGAQILVIHDNDYKLEIL